MHRNYVPHILVGFFLFGFFCSDFSDFWVGEENFSFFGIKNFDFEVAVFTMSSSCVGPSGKNSCVY